VALGEPVRTRTVFPAGTALPDGRLDLCKQDLGPLGAAAIADALPGGGGPVKHLLLGTDGLGDGGAAAVVPKAVAAKVETLYLGCNGIGGGVCEIAGRLIASPGVVKALWLKRNPVGPDGVRAVAETVRAGTVLRTIDLTQTGLAVGDVSVLVDAMIAAGGGIHAAERLYLSGNRLGADGAQEVARLLGAGAVAELYVSAAALGDAGALVLAEALRQAPARAATPVGRQQGHRTGGAGRADHGGRRSRSRALRRGAGHGGRDPGRGRQPARRGRGCDRRRSAHEPAPPRLPGPAPHRARQPRRAPSP
jgi:hypothetical protein